MRFRDRADAGRRLAALLLPYRGEGVQVLGLARGGLRVGFEVARALEAPLDVWVARRLGAPGRTSVAAAVSEGGGLYVDPEALRLSPLSQVNFQDQTREEMDEVDRQVQRLRARPPPEVSRRTVLLVDDGLVTGSTATAALRALRRRWPARLVLGVGVATLGGLELARREADAVHCVETLPGMRTVSEAYDDFAPISDVEVRQLLERSREPSTRSGLESTDLGGTWL